MTKKHRKTLKFCIKTRYCFGAGLGCREGGYVNIKVGFGRYKLHEVIIINMIGKNVATECSLFAYAIPLSYVPAPLNMVAQIPQNILIKKNQSASTILI